MEKAKKINYPKLGYTKLSSEVVSREKFEQWIESQYTERCISKELFEHATEYYYPGEVDSDTQLPLVYGRLFAGDRHILKNGKYSETVKKYFPRYECLSQGCWLPRVSTIDGQLSKYTQIKAFKPRVDKFAKKAKKEAIKYDGLPDFPINEYDFIAHITDKEILKNSIKIFVKKWKLDGINPDKYESYLAFFNDVKSKVPVLSTEGFGKHLSLIEHGYLSVFLAGVNSWGQKVGDVTKYNPDNTKMFNDNLRELLTGCLEIRLCFDADQRTKKNVKDALKDFAKSVKSEIKVPVLSYEWDPEFGKGVDDFFFNGYSLENNANLLEVNTDPERVKVPSSDQLADKIMDVTNNLEHDLEHQSFVKYEFKDNGVWSSIQDEIILSEVINNYLKSNNYYCYSGNYLKDVLYHLKISLQRRSWPEKNHLIPFQDGVFDTLENKFSEHDPDNFLTWSLPYKFNTDVTEWTNINNFMDEVTDGNISKKNKAICYCAAIVRRMYKLQKFLHLQGPGGTGKGTFCKLVAALVGEENCSALSESDLQDKESLANMLKGSGKPLTILDDLATLNNQQLKVLMRLTGEGKVTARNLYKDGFNTVYKGMCIITSNNPVFVGSNTEITRRAIVLNFTKIPKKPRNLMREFEPELPAFLKYLMSLPVEYIENTLNENYAQITSTLWSSQILGDGLSSWINDELIFDESARTQIGCDGNQWSSLSDYDPIISTLYGSYALHCKSTGRQSKLSKDKFSAELIRVCEQLNWSVNKQKDSRGLMVIAGVRLRGHCEITPTILEILENKENQQSQEVKGNVAIPTVSDQVNEGNSGVTLNKVEQNQEKLTVTAVKTVKKLPETQETPELKVTKYTLNNPFSDPPTEVLMNYFSEKKAFYINDYIADFYLGCKGHSSPDYYFTPVSRYLKKFVEEGVLRQKGAYYQVINLPCKKEEMGDQSLNEVEVINTLKQVNKYIDCYELSMVYFDGYNTLKLASILDNLVAKNIVQTHVSDKEKYRYMGENYEQN